MPFVARSLPEPSKSRWVQYGQHQQNAPGRYTSIVPDVTFGARTFSARYLQGTFKKVPSRYLQGTFKKVPSRYLR